MATLLQALALLSCILYASSEKKICVDSIDINSQTIVYSNATNQDTFTQNIAPFLDEISIETMIILLNFTVSSNVNGNESRIYQVSKTSLCYLVSPELIDLMTFDALAVVERTQLISINIHSFAICANQSWEKLLLKAFNVDEAHGFARLVQQNEASNQTYYSAIVSSGLLMFMPLGLTSLFALFVVLLPIVGTTASRKCASLTNRHHFQHCLGALSQVFASIRILNVGVYAIYLVYMFLNAVCYFLNLGRTSEVLASQYSVPPFASNLIFLLLTVCVSFLSGLCFRGNDQKQCSCVFQTSIACNFALASAGLYHFLFLLLVLVEDFNTAFSSILIKVTFILSLYTLFPTALQHYRVAKARKQFCSLWFVLSLLTVVPFLYSVTLIGAKDLFNAGHLYIATKFWFAVVLFMTLLVWTVCFFMLASAFKRTSHPSSHKQSENNQQNGPKEGIRTITDAEKVPHDPTTSRALVVASRKPEYCSTGSFTDHFVPPVVMVYLKGTSKKKRKRPSEFV